MTLKKSLLSLFSELFAFSKKDFHFLSYGYTFILVITCIYFNYSSGFYNNVMRPTYSNGDSVWAFPLFYSIIYFVVAIPVLLFQKDYKLLRNTNFYIKSLFFIVLYGVSIGYFGYRDWEFPSLFSEERVFTIKAISQLKGSIIYVIPLFILKRNVDKNVDGLYGLASNSRHIHAYLTLFLILLPFLIAASFTPDFLSAYPQFHPWTFNGIFGFPTWWYTMLYETTYAIDFVKTELVFRGMLVIGMASIMDRKAILPMVAMYAAAHFGKPIGETLSSIFGGYILGVLAYQTRHIWGGVIVHICIALTMEMMGFIQYYILKQ
jgi:hypothetical protein